MVKIECGPHTLTIIIIISILVFAILYYLIDVNSKESQFENLNSEDKDNFLQKLFLSVSIQATSGWTRVTPKTNTTRILTIMQMLTSIFLVLYIASYIMLKKK